jgi:tetratricopeptide (TPR) repeat protein
MKPSSVQSLLIGWFGLLVLGIGLVPAQPYYADSISDYWVAVQSNPDSMLQVMQTAQEQSALHSRDRAAVLLIQAYAWFYKDNYSKALQLANHSASISPDVAPGMVEYITIVALQEEHKYHEALAHGHLSVSITGSPHSYLQRSRVYYNLGMYHKALSDVQTAIKKS